MPWIIGGSFLLGSYLSSESAKSASKASKKAAKAQIQGSEQQIAEMRREFDAMRADYKPFMDIELQRAQTANQGYQQLYNEVTGAGPSKFQTSPGYQFRMDQAQKAVDRQASVQGMLNTPTQQKALYRYSQGLASDEYNNYIRNLSGLSMQQAMPATQATETQRMQTAGNVGSAYRYMGQSRAQNAINQGNISSNFYDQVGKAIGYAGYSMGY